MATLSSAALRAAALSYSKVPGYNTLKLPKYGTLAEMRSALLRAATYGNEGAQSWE